MEWTNEKMRLSDEKNRAEAVVEDYKIEVAHFPPISMNWNKGWTKKVRSNFSCDALYKLWNLLFVGDARIRLKGEWESKGDNSVKLT